MLNGCTSSADGVLQVSRESLELQGSTPTAAFSISNEGKEDSVLSWTLRSDNSALSVTPTKGALAAGESERLDVSLDRSGLTAGQQFRATLTVDSSGGRASVAVSYTMVEGGLANCGQASTSGDRKAFANGGVTATAPLPVEAGYVAGELLVKFAPPMSLSSTASAQSATAQRRALLSVAQKVAADYASRLERPCPNRAACAGDGARR